ncbi:MAG: hypothetical protein KC613_07295 [Myxococcales bacterium]|nr:hypothetical protein [Myxococcales bacterium]
MRALFLASVTWAAATWAVALAGCGELDPAIGPDREALPDLCAAGDSDPATAVPFAEVRQRVFGQFCGCHTTPGGLGQTVGGLDLDTRDAILLGGFRSQENIVVPGDPCGSILIQKVGPTPPFGARMPLNGATLSADLRQLLIDWIAEGANP